jgi:C4-dicarboxylate transporter DctM subunit
MADRTHNKYLFLLIINITLLIIGCVIDNIPATLILSPMLLPAMQSFGVDPVHFGVFMTVNLLIGLVTPPYGCSLFVASAVCNVQMEEMLKHVLMPLLILIASLLIITYIPGITMFFVK